MFAVLSLLCLCLTFRWSFAYNQACVTCGQRKNVDDAIAFPGESGRRADDYNATIRSNYIIPPVDFVQKINNFSVSDLLLHYVDDYEEESMLASRFGTSDLERSSAIQPKPATCMPELQTVKLIDDVKDPSIIFIPSCTRIERCAGCCSHNLLSCQPVDTEIVHFKVIKTQFFPGNRLKFIGKDVIHVEKHTKCTCGCRVQAKDCTQVQIYMPDECRCKCANNDEEKKCHANSSKKLWDYTTCSCQCRNTTICSTGFTFDSTQCHCVPIPKRRHVLQSSQSAPNEEHKRIYQIDGQFPIGENVNDEYDY